MELKKSLAPVINPDSAVLILGSMPGEESLRRQQYYGFSANHFWRLTAAVLYAGQNYGKPPGTPPDDYLQRLEMLAAGKIALWDVIASCTRQGSLDTNIKNEVANDLPALFKRHAGGNGSLKAVFFNGQKAANSFKRSFGMEILSEYKFGYGVLPSSSPANTIGFENKLEQWMVIQDYLC